jgi:hypothetical protein
MVRCVQPASRRSPPSPSYRTVGQPPQQAEYATRSASQCLAHTGCGPDSSPTQSRFAPLARGSRFAAPAASRAVRSNPRNPRTSFLICVPGADDAPSLELARWRWCGRGRRERACQPRELEVEHSGVGADPVPATGLGDNDDLVLDRPAEHHLGGGAAQAFGDRNDRRMALRSSASMRSRP